MQNIKEKAYASIYILVFGGCTIYNWQARQNNSSLFWVLIIQIFLIQAAASIPATIFKTQQFYDLTGSLTNIFVTATATFFNPNISATQIIAALILAIWAVRMGSFLFLRILKQKSDRRFNQIKINPVKFFFVWLLQGLWIAITISPLLIVMTQYPNHTNNTLVPFEYIGGGIWIVGFAVEVVADWQKNNFRSNQSNKQKFITDGLWKYSRHPNYAGEITLWTGAAIFSIASLKDYELFSLISPIFVYILLSFISGVPMLQQRSDEKWSQLPQYQQYKRNTPVLFPCGTLCESKEKSYKMLE